jgi:hypothetical protein
MKHLFRYVLATLLATTVYYYSNGTESNYEAPIQAQMVEDQYKITDETHPFEGLVGTLSEIEAECPSSGQTCAMKVGSRTEIIEWDGGTTKF